MLRAPEQESLNALAPFFALYVITLTYGSAIILDDGGRAEPFATYNNHQRFLEVRARLIVTDLVKLLIPLVCIFWTELNANQWCAPDLLDGVEAWKGPLEISDGGLLTSFR